MHPWRWTWWHLHLHDNNNTTSAFPWVERRHYFWVNDVLRQTMLLALSNFPGKKTNPTTLCQAWGRIYLISSGSADPDDFLWISCTLFFSTATTPTKFNTWHR
jgi:hypothetical protein